MRALLILLAIVALALLAALQFGFVSFDQTRAGVVQAPQYKADVAEVKLGMENKTIAVPTLTVDKPAENATAQ